MATNTINIKVTQPTSVVNGIVEISVTGAITGINYSLDGAAGVPIAISTGTPVLISGLSIGVHTLSVKATAPVAAGDTTFSTVVDMHGRSLITVSTLTSWFWFWVILILVVLLIVGVVMWKRSQNKY